VSAEPRSRRLAAILAADVVGYSRLIGADEPGTLAKLASVRSTVVDPQIATHGGRVFKTTGDGLLAEFASGVQAVECAIAIQQAMRAQEGIQLRVGLHSADVTVQPDGDLLGDGVNVASRLEALAEPGGICISGRVREDALGKLSLEVEDLGEPELKNITQRHRVFRVRLDAPERPALTVPDKLSLVVLPFENMSGDPEQEYFADGMVEDITSALSRIGGLMVIARNSAFTYKGRAVDVRQVGRELGVRYVLEGSVRRSGERVRITCQLIEAATGTHVWTDRSDDDLRDVFALQDRVTESVAAAIEPSLQRAEIARAMAKPTESLDAYDLYLRALYHYHLLTRENYETVVNLLRRAIEIDPGFARAKALAAFSISFMVSFTWLSRESAEGDEAIALARDALANARDDPTTLRFAGDALAYLAGDNRAGRVALDRAMVLNPNSAQLLLASGWIHLYAGEWALACDELERSIRLSPLNPEMPIMLTGLSAALTELGELERALELARKAVTMGYGLSHLITSLVLLGRLDEAREEAKRHLQTRPSFTIARWLQAAAPFPESFIKRRVPFLRAAGIPE
jgi:adenylate cyclase